LFILSMKIHTKWKISVDHQNVIVVIFVGNV
jgi:hypothetical protein